VTADTSSISGYLESPEAWHPSTGELPVSGWVFSAGSPVRLVEAVVDDGPPVPLVHGLARADVRRRFGSAESERSGFLGAVTIPVNRRLVRLECVVTLANGQRTCALARTVRLYEGGLWARFGRVGRAIQEALQLVARERRLPPSPWSWPATLWRHWRGVPALRRARLGTPQPFDRDRLDASFQHGFTDWTNRPAIALADSPPSLVTVPREPHEVGDRCDAAGMWLPAGAAEYVVLLDSTTEATRDGVARAARALAASGADWLYSDDCRRDAEGRLFDPYLKGAFSPEQALVDGYATRLAVGRRTTIARVGGLNARLGNDAIHDLVLRLSAAGASIAHLPEVCAYRAAPVPASPSDAALAAAAAVLGNEIGQVVSIERRRDALLEADLPRVVWPERVLDAAPVTIVIPNRDRVDLLRRCIDSLRRTVDPRRTRVVVVDDRSRDRATRSYFDRLAHLPDLRCRVVRAPDPDGRFNYARLMNYGVTQVETPLVLHLNNDVEAIETGWLDQMIGWLSRPAVGVVGARLTFRDRSLQHAGVAVSPSHGVPEHLFQRLRGTDAGYQWLPHRLRNVSAVTGACLLTRTALYRELDGFDAQHLPVQFNDIDYCLRASARGWRVVYEPAAVLWHDESVSRGGSFDYRENVYFAKAYQSRTEPYVSSHFDAASLFSATPEVTASPNRLD
jgi:GT2 family glycosyltransferase